MGSVVQDKKAWQDVVAEKRRVQAELLARFNGQGHENTKGNGDFKSERAKPIECSKLVALLASGELSCEALVKSHIEKLVVKWPKMWPK